MKKLIIFGQGLYAEIAHQYFTDDSDYEVVISTVDDDYRKQDEYLSTPMVNFSNIENIYAPSEFDLFIAVSYTEMNHLRKRIYYEAKQKGYNLPSYVSSRCSWMTKYPIGDNCFIFEDNTIQPFTKIGNNVILWSGNHIGHHGQIKDHNFVSSHVVISGQCVIEENCFIGVNSTIGHKVTIGKESLIGAGSVITRDTEEGSVYVPQKSIKLDRHSRSFRL